MSTFQNELESIINIKYGIYCDFAIKRHFMLSNNHLSKIQLSDLLIKKEKENCLYYDTVTGDITLNNGDIILYYNGDKYINIYIMLFFRYVINVQLYNYDFDYLYIHIPDIDTVKDIIDKYNNTVKY